MKKQIKILYQINEGTGKKKKAQQNFMILFNKQGKKNFNFFFQITCVESSCSGESKLTGFV